MSSIFNPQEFFTNTSHWVSTGRGLFRLNDTPKVLQDSTDSRIQRGIEVLKRGIVAKSFGIQGQSLATYEDFSYTGPTRKMAYGQIFQDIQVNFILMDEKEEFAAAVYHTITKWQEKIAGPQNGETGGVRSDSTSFGVRYYDDYVVDATTTIYTPTASKNKPVIEARLTELYPITVGDLQVSWDNPDTPMTFSTTFAYHYIQIQGKS